MFDLNCAKLKKAIYVKRKRAKSFSVVIRNCLPTILSQPKPDKLLRLSTTHSFLFNSFG